MVWGNLIIILIYMFIALFVKGTPVRRRGRFR